MRFMYLLMVLSVPAFGQWTLQESHSTASLRGIHSVGNGVAWASGSNGTVLRTVDSGKTWETCAVPPGGEKLDFRGIQGFDGLTAIVMASGKGEESRLYRTTDGCLRWRLILTNPDREGFWDALKADTPEHAYILGDSVASEARLLEWKQGWEERELEAVYGAKGKVDTGEDSFAASNSVLEIVTAKQVDKHWTYSLRWSSGAAEHAYFNLIRAEAGACEPCIQKTERAQIPLGDGSSNAGTFSFAFRTSLVGVAVGGNYTKAASTIKTAAVSSDGGMTWEPAMEMPHGYRSAVAYYAASRSWITVGPNGTDVSTDDGRDWRPLRPGAGEAADADQHWNALSLPFVVGSHGRIGILRANAIAP